jgi:putative acetyltransferase
MPYTLGPATNDDRSAVQQVVFGVLAEYGLSPDPGGTDADLRDLDASYHSAGGSFDVLIDESGTVVGTVALARVSETTCELRKMYLARSARGQGWGRRLLEHALVRAGELGFTRVVLETASVLREAIALYERSGFRPYVPAHLAARCDTAYYLDLTPKGDPRAR